MALFLRYYAHYLLLICSTMRHICNIVALLVMLFMPLTLLAQEHGEGNATLHRSVPDSLRRTYRHTDAVQLLSIHRDTLAALDIWRDILHEDSNYAPANYYLSKICGPISEKSVDYARRAYEADSTNKWYAQNYGTQLITIGNYKDALPVYRRLLKIDKHDIASYYGLAYLYGIGDMPYSAISVLDSADIRLGRNPQVSALKQQLLLDTKQYDRAVEEGVKVVSEFPYNMESRLSLARTYERAGRDSMALVALEEALRIDSTDVAILDYLSSYYARRGNVARMFDYDAKIMQSDELAVDEKVHRLSQYTFDMQFYADNYFRIGALIQQMALKHPNHRAVVDMYASHMIMGGESEAALVYLRRHLSDTSVGVNDYIYTMQLEHFLKRDDLLFEDLEAAMRLYPTNFDLLSFAGFIYSDKGHYSEAIEIFKACLKIANDDKQRGALWGYIGDVYHEQGMDNRAFKAYDKALGYHPDNVLVLNNYAYFLSLLDRHLERALTMSARAIYLEPKNSSYQDTHAWVLHRLGRNDEAKSVMRQALSLSSQRDANLLMHYGDILWALGEKFLAETYWEKAVSNGYDSEEMERHKAELMK